MIILLVCLLQNEYVFVNSITKNKHGNINDVFPEFLKKAEIKSFCFHDLRHTSATRMVECGIDLVVQRISRTFRHKNYNEICPPCI